MDPIVNAIDMLNTVGQRFCVHAGSVLIQSSLLIAALVIVDVLLRRRVRAVVRYALWMLVFVKLLLPPGLSLPTGIGYYRPRPVLVVREVAEPVEEGVFVRQSVGGILPSPVPMPVDDSVPAPAVAAPSGPALTWQAWLLLGWLAGVVILCVCLARRFRYVQKLVRQSMPASSEMQALLAQCAARLKLRHCPVLRLSDETPGPVVCRLVRPVVLMSTAMADKVSEDRLRTVLIHELAHIKRADLWVNFVQTLLLVAYFYHPLLWLANAIVRRLREQAVDEMVLVALDAEAESYSTTLIDLAEMALARPILGLRLIGIAESKKALEGRIRHMMTRPKPKSARVGTWGLLAIAAVAAVLLPMASATVSTPSGIPSDSNELALFLRDRLSENDRKIDNITFATERATVRSEKYRQTAYEHALAMGEPEQEARTMLDSHRVRFVGRFALDRDYCGRVERVSGRTNANGDWVGETDSMVVTWDGRTGIEFRKEPETGHFPYSAVIGERPVECSKRYAQPWRDFLGWPAESLADAIRRGVSVTAEKVRDAYRVEFDYGSGAKTVYVIDPAQGFSVVSRQRFSNDTLLASYTARFQEVSPGLWFPVEGEIVNGSVESGEARAIFEVSQVRVNAPDFYENLHSVDFPKGTSVFDQRTRLRYVIGEASQGEIPRLIIDHAIPLPKGEDLEARVVSRTRLSDLGKALLIYANDHDDRFPEQLSDVREELRASMSWLLENVTYLGQGISPVRDHPSRVLAYDKTLLAQGHGTNVLYLDSHVAFETPEALGKLGIELRPKSPAEIQKETELRARVNVLTKLKNLALAAFLFAGDHNDRFAESLEDLKPYLGQDEDLWAWVSENVEYVGGNTQATDAPLALRPVAYCRLAQDAPDELAVAFQDGHVETFKGPRLQELKILTTHGAAQEMRRDSAVNLSRLAKALLIHANDHDDRFPDRLEDLPEDARIDAAWVRQHVVYMGDGVSALDRPERALAFDKTLLAAGSGTNVLYLDAHVAFEQPDTLKRLGIGIVHEARTLEEARRVGVLSDLKQLAMAAHLYAGENQARFPDSVQDLEPYLADKHAVWIWASEKVTYLGKGAKISDERLPFKPLAYYRFPSEASDEMAVAFQDGHVEFVKGLRLKELGIAVAP